ncbi:CesT family type III secretion system chaperone [Ramlibacter sp.]|uniref:CesT family type III secretion system chaperone n=1 Tax=Ramlibacter sp. TaxID=1917967 RepID=UPI003D0F4FBE
MSAHSLQDLAAQFCTYTGVATPRLGADDDGVIAFSTVIDGVAVTVANDPLQRAGDILVCVYFGELPAEREADVMRGLLHANFLMQAPDGASFGVDPGSREVVLKSLLPMAEITGESLHEGMRRAVELVRQWRADPFHEPARGEVTSADYA